MIENRRRASDFFQDWWAEVTHGAKKNGGSFPEMMGPSISNYTQLTLRMMIGVVYFTYTLTQRHLHAYVY